MIIIKRDNPKVFGGKAYLMTDDEAQAINTIAGSISINRGPLVELLRAHDYMVDNNATKEELLQHLTKAYNNKQFAQEYAKLMLGKKYSNEDGEDSPNTQQTQSVGGGWLGAISGIVGGIGGIIQSFQKPSQAQLAAEYQQQILQLAAEKERSKERNKKIAIAIIAIIVIAGIFFGFSYAKKQKMI